MKLLLTQTTLLFAALFTLEVSAQATTVSVTFVGTPTGVSDGTDFVLPYQLDIGGNLTLATCYDIFDNVSKGQTWTASELTVDQAAATGQYKNQANALAGYKAIAFLSQQTTASPQNQIDLQHDIWNVFAEGTFAVDSGMQVYLNLLTTSAYTNFDFDNIRFLEDVNQTSGRAQAFVFDPPASTPEPGTIVLMSIGALLIGFGRITRRDKFRP